MGNREKGVFIFNGAQHNTIGGSIPGARNIISGNEGTGVQLEGAGTDSNLVVGNYIGTDVTGMDDLGNTWNGIWIWAGAGHNLFQENIIVHNGGKGISISNPTAIGNTITQNSITANRRQGIDLSDNGNTELPAPTLTTVSATEVSGTVDGSRVPDGSIVEVFNDPMDEGKTFLGSATVSGGAFSFIGTIPTTGYITATVTDPDGNTSEFSEVDLLPIVVSTEPGNGDTLDLTENIRAFFNEGMDESTLNSSTVLVSASTSGDVNGNIWYEDWRNAVVFDPDEYLPAGETVTVTIKTGAQDQNGNGLDGNGNGVADGSPDDDYEWSFTVVDIPPKVTRKFPPQDGIADPDIRITAAFDRAMDPGTLNASTFLVSGSESGTMNGTVTYDEASWSATFFPEASFVEGETVTVTLTTGVQKDTGVGLDGDGDGVAEGSPTDDYTWSFVTTAPMVCTAYPARKAPVLDGVIEPGEYRYTVPMKVNFDDPTTRPGIVPDWIAPPADRDDLSYVVCAMYDEENLYIAVDVTDDVLIDDSGSPYKDDCVEIWMDGDEVANDFSIGGSVNREGGGVKMDVGGDINDRGIGAYGTDWLAEVDTRPGGYVVEFRIPLLSIDIKDGEGESHPTSGSSIGILFSVDDDDNGGGPYEHPDDSYGAWTGSYDNWHHARESDWGMLHFSETPRPVDVAAGLGVAGPGGQAVVPVRVDDLSHTSVTSGEIALTYDPEILTFVKAMPGQGRTYTLDANALEPDSALVVFATQTRLVNTPRNTLFHAVFDVNPNAALGAETEVEVYAYFNEGDPPATTSPGTVMIDLVGDASRNEEIRAHDGALILMHTVGTRNLVREFFDGDKEHFLLICDVTRNGKVAPMDVARLLQYLVRKVPGLPYLEAPAAKTILPATATRTIALSDVRRREGRLDVSVGMDDLRGVLAGVITVEYDASAVRPVEVIPSGKRSGDLFAYGIEEGEIRICFAGTEEGEGSGELARIRFEVLSDEKEMTALTLDAVLNEGTIPVSGSALEIPLSSAIPTVYALHQNVPNPFNPETGISYDLPESGRARLSIYNLSGQLIRMLVDGERPAGSYSVVWDGRDDAGRNVASGIYLCRMEAGEYSAVRKLVLVR